MQTKMIGKKLKIMLQYINATINMKMTLSVDDLSIIKTRVDASYATHNDIKSHTVAIITLGLGEALRSEERRASPND